MIKSQKGQATVELAISLSVVLLLIFGMIDFGRIFHTYLTLEHAGREAARVASVGGTDIQVIQRAREASPSLHANHVTVNVSPGTQNRTRGSYTTVQLSYPVSISTPLIQNVVPNPFVVNVRTVMRVE